jgi:hypothetical protein
MGAASGALAHGFCGVSMRGVDGKIGAQRRCLGQPGVVVVDGADEQTHGFGILHGEIAVAAESVDGDPLTGTGGGVFEATIAGDAGADERSGLRGRQSLGDGDDRVGVGKDVLGEAAIGVAAEPGVGAELARGALADMAVAARGAEPGDTNAIAFLHVLHTEADFRDDTDGLVSRREG